MWQVLHSSSSSVVVNVVFVTGCHFQSLTVKCRSFCSHFLPQDASPQRQQTGHDSYFGRYSKWAEPDAEWAGPSRHRRATKSSSNRMCALFLQSDPLLWEYMTKKVASGGKGYVSVL